MNITTEEFNTIVMHLSNVETAISVNDLSSALLANKIVYNLLMLKKFGEIRDKELSYLFNFENKTFAK